MDVLEELVRNFPSRLGRVPTAMNTLFSRLPDVKHECENMHHYFTFSDEKLAVEIMIGMSVLPCIIAYTINGQTIKTTAYVYDHSKFDDMINNFRQKIGIEVNPVDRD